MTMTNDEMITRLEGVVAELTKDLDTMTKVANDEGLTISQIEYAYSVDKEVMDAEIERLTQRARELETQLKDEEETYYNAWKCGWCNERFPTPAEAMDHALSCETHPLVQRVKELEDANRWIPVGERLPKVGEEVLTYSILDKSYNCIGFYVLNSNKKPHWVNEKTYNDIYPQFWMPLPPLPDVPQEGE